MSNLPSHRMIRIAKAYFSSKDPDALLKEAKAVIEETEAELSDALYRINHETEQHEKTLKENDELRRMNIEATQLASQLSVDLHKLKEENEELKAKSSINFMAAEGFREMWILWESNYKKTPIYLLVLSHFNGNEEKAFAWFDAENPLLGNITPIEMIAIGKISKLRKFIEASLRGNKPK